MKKFYLILCLPFLLLAEPSLSADSYQALLAGKQISVSLSQSLGRIVVVTWVNPDCPFIKMHDKKQSFYKLAKKYQSQPVSFVSVNSTHFHDLEKSSSWASDNQVFWPVVIDSSGKLGKEFGAKTTPHVFIFDQQGSLVYAGAYDSDPSGEEEKVENYVELTVDALLKQQVPANTAFKPYGCSVKYKD